MSKRRNIVLKIVSAAIVCESGCYLIAQRPEGDPYEGLWEFPGGKVKVGEDPRATLVRECEEELDCVVSVGDPFEVVFHDYDDYAVLILAFNAAIAEGTPTALECGKIAMVKPNEMMDYEFLPADRPIVDKILKQSQTASTGAI